MTVSRFVKDFDSVIRQTVAQRGLKLAKGHAKDYPEYQREVGRCEGLAMAVDLAREMLRRAEQSDDEPELPEMKQGND